MKKDIEEFYDEDEDEDFYTKKDLEQDRFYKMDKNLFNNSKYKGLSLGAKVVFSVLKDRQSLSESNQEDWLDVIELSVHDHHFLHRYIVYDQERMMYRDLDGVLLDSKEKHIEYFEKCKTKYND